MHRMLQNGARELIISGWVHIRMQLTELSGIYQRTMQGITEEFNKHLGKSVNIILQDN